MKLWQRCLCIACTLILTAGMVVPTLSTISAEEQTEAVTLSDGSQWLVKSDAAHNTFSTDGDGRYFMTTDAPNSEYSAFSLISGAVFPLSTKFQLRCREAAGGQTRFGLSASYSLDLNGDNTIYFLRLNGSPSENAAKLFVIIGGETICIKTTDAKYTHNRVSTIGVTKQNGSWYMTWNGLVLDAEGCSDEVREYVKMENHFPLEALESGISLHFFASCSKMNTADGFSLKPDRVISGGITATAADTYTDPNNPATQTKTTRPSAEFNEETGTYRVTIPSNVTYAAVMSPVTTIDSKTGESDVFNVEAFLENYSSTSQNWVQFDFSNDPTFSDGTEVSFCAVKLANSGGVHLLYRNELGTYVTSSGMNNNFFNDLQGSARSWQFKTDGDTGDVYLYIWGSNLTSATSPHKVSEDFGSLSDKPIYIRIFTQAVGAAKTTVHVTPDNGPEVAAAVAETDALALIVPKDLEEAEKIVAQYDASPYRYAISDEGLSAALASKMFLYEKREEKIKAQIAALKSRIAALPAPEELDAQYTDALKEEICDTYLDYIALGDYRDRVEESDLAKLQALLDRLPELDSEFAQMKQAAENFEKSVAELKKLGAIDVSNYPERNRAIGELEALYDKMNDYMRSFVSAGTLADLAALKEELLSVQEAYEVNRMIDSLPPAAEVTLADENAIIAARRAYDRLSEPAMVPAAAVQHLTECEERLETLKLTELDWYCGNSEITYTGNNTDSYSFTDSRDKVSGYIFATTTADYDMTANTLYWIGMGCGSGQFALLGLSAQTNGQQLSQTDGESISFVLRPSGSALKVTFFDAKGEAENVANIAGFDFSLSHSFAFEKAEDGHWYLIIDGNRITSVLIDLWKPTGKRLTSL